MTTEQNPDSTALIDVTASTAVEVPQGVTEEEAADLRARAVEVVEQLRDATGARALEIVDRVSTVGLQAQRRAGADLALLRVRIGDLISENGGGASEGITRDLVDLRLTLSQLDPDQGGLLRRVVRALPLGRSQLLRALETIAVRHEPISRQVVVLESRLREGRMMLTRDNIELRKLYEQVEGQQQVVRRNAYMAEIVMQHLEQLLGSLSDERGRERVQGALYDVVTRIQDLRVMEEVQAQFFVSLEMTRQNNSRLGQAVDRTLTLATNVVMVGLAIQSALIRQRRVLEATRRTREFVGDLLMANAASMKQHTIEIGDVYSSPVIALDKIRQAHVDLVEAIALADRLKSEGIVAAREHIAQLARLAGDLQARSEGLRETKDVPSLEAP
jgi:uncharacterized protein YaaN involved in tellurite resistance